MNKPVCNLIGEDGNIFVLAARVSDCLKKAGLRDQAFDFKNKLVLCKSYEEALVLMEEYIEIE